MIRREWIKKSALLSGSIALAPSLRSQSAKPVVSSAAPGASTHGFINLSINENQLGPSPGALAAMQRAIPYAFEYPAGPFRQLRNEIAARENVAPSQVLIGAGSSDLLKAASYAFGLPGGSIVSSDPTFNDLMRWAEPHGAEILAIPWNEDHQPDLPGLLATIRGDTALVYICNPENPAGTLLSRDSLRSFCREAAERCPVFIDEAYIDFAGEADQLTMMDLVREGLPVVVSRTFSKAHGLGGMRVGYAITTAPLAARLESQYVTGVVSGASHVSIEGARAAYADTSWLAHVRAETAKARAAFAAFCDELDQPYIPSSTTFMLLPVRHDSKLLADTLFNATRVKISPRLIHGQNYLRISMGKPEQMRQLQQGLRLVLPS